MDIKKEEIVEPEYILRTAFNPIRGLDEDLQDFLHEFIDLGTPRFVRFSELWRKHKFIHLIYGRKNQAGLCDILGCIFHRLVDLAQPHVDRIFFARVCALYLLYAFHGKQPIRNHVRIRVSPDAWTGILQLADEAHDNGHLDVYYVFRQLCASNAFSFCANRQVLYPGAPLFDSPAIQHDDHLDDASGLPTCFNVSQQNHAAMTSSRDAMMACLPVVKALKSHSSALTQAVQCLNLSLSRYAESKRLLNQASTSDQKDEMLKKQFGVEDEDEEYDEFCHGLNLVTHPDSIKHLHSISEDLIQLSELSCLDNRFNKKLVPSSTRHKDTNHYQSISAETSKLRTSPRKRSMTNPTSTSKTGDHNSEQSSNKVGQRQQNLRQSAVWSSFVRKEVGQNGTNSSPTSKANNAKRAKIKSSPSSNVKPRKSTRSK